MADKQRPWAPPQIFWSALVAVVFWSALGFSWFGYGFDWTTQSGARKMERDAVMETLATICAGQARAAPNAETALKELWEMQSWKRVEFVEKAGWAVMPGSESSQSGVSTRCVSMLIQT